MPRKKQKQIIQYGCRTDVGQVRDHNEDSLLVESPLFAVADGMGGHAAGEVASEIAVQSLRENGPRVANAEWLGKAVEQANTDVLRAAIEGKGKQGMGTTMTAAVIEGEQLVVAQVGDSRAYLLHNGKLQQITRDHSFMADLIEQGQITPAEARVHPNRSLITRALGSDPEMVADQYEIRAEAGDRLLLCSDGLSGMIEDSIIEGILNETKDPQKCANTLVEQANAHVGQDNITVIVADIEGQSAKIKKKAINKTRRAIIITAILLLAIIAGGIALGYNIVNNSAYLCEEDGVIQVYKGVPGTFLGIQLSTKECSTDVRVADLRESSQQHFKDGVLKASDLESAERIVENYRQEAKELKDSKGTPADTSKQQGAKK